MTGSNHKPRSPESLSFNKSCFLGCDVGWSNDGIRDSKTKLTKYHNNPNSLFFNVSIYPKFLLFAAQCLLISTILGDCHILTKVPEQGWLWPDAGHSEPIPTRLSGACMQVPVCRDVQMNALKVIMLSLKKTV